jgi:putative flippase GtrA
LVVFVAQLVPSDWRKTFVQFLRFGVVGGVGFGVDTGTVYALHNLIGVYAAGLVSFLLAATGNWALNRIWTFRGHGNGSALRQWALFLAANSAGFVLNRGTFFALVATVAAVRAHLVLGTLAGTLAGMGANFVLSHRVVFQAHRAAESDFN